MKKALCYCEYIIYILVINMATFILRPMDWNVLSGKLLAFNWPSIAEFISNLLIFILTIFIIACFFKPEKKLPLSMFAEVFFKKILLPSVAIRFAADIIYFISDLLFNPYSFAVAFITEAVCMFLIFNIIKCKLGGGETAAAGKSSKYGFIGGIIVLLIIIGFYIY